MALIACPACESPVSVGAKACPHCGQRSPGTPNGLRVVVLGAFLGFWVLVGVLFLWLMISWMA